MDKIAIIGGGITGVSAGRILSAFSEICIFEAKSELGGLIHCDRVHDVLYHRVGGHVFNAKSKEVKNWIEKLVDFESELVFRERKAMILIGGGYVGYPIENHLYQLPEDMARKSISELLMLPEQPDRSSFGSFLRTSFGRTLYENYFQPYNAKIWDSPLDEIPVGWLEGKLPMPNRTEVLQNNILRIQERETVHSTFYYPKAGGSQFWIDRIGEGLNKICSHKIETFEYEDGVLKINDLGQVYNKIVYTGDIRQFPVLSGVNDPVLFKLLDECKYLKTRGVTNALCECDTNELSWLYLPEDSLSSHRIIYTGSFSPTNNRGLADGRSSCVVEFAYNVEKEIMEQEIKRLPGNLKIIGTNSEANAYIIQNSNTRALVNEIKKRLKPYGIYLAGRFSEWEYYNMDKCIERSLGLQKELYH